MEYKGFLFEKRNGVALLTLNRPEKLNAMTGEMVITSLPNIMRQVEQDNEIRVLIITGAGKGFCSGVDLGDVNPATQARVASTLRDRIEPFGFLGPMLCKLSKPVIAAVNGVAAGAGLSLALAADIRIASENAKFSTAFVKRGLVPDWGATFLMPKLIGVAKALELMYMGDNIDAQSALRLGLVNSVVPADKLADEANAFAKRLASGPPIALAQLKRAVFDQFISEFEQQLFIETYAQGVCFGTEDFAEGIKAFQEKREPKFKGR